MFGAYAFGAAYFGQGPALSPVVQAPIVMVIELEGSVGLTPLLDGSEGEPVELEGSVH